MRSPSSYLAQGVTFDFAGEERPSRSMPFRASSSRPSGSTVEAGIKQRVRALEAFLADVYGAQRAVRDGVIPAAPDHPARATSTARPRAS